MVISKQPLLLRHETINLNHPHPILYINRRRSGYIPGVGAEIYYSSLNYNNMKQELATITTTEIMSIGKAFAESGMFPDIKTAAQAVVKIQAGAEIGLPPFASMSGIHIIQGKPTVGAGLIAATVKGSGKYDYRVIEQSEKVCSIDFFQGKERLGNSTFTLEDAKKAGTKNIDKFPKNMLFARAVSNGVKWFCPDIFSGPVYTPEEFGVEVKTEDAPHTEVDRAGFLAEWQIEVDKADSKAKLVDLYNAHKDTVDQDEALKGMFAAKQKSFKPAATVTA